MKAFFWLLLAVSAVAVVPGCLFVPRADLDAARADNQVLAEQNRAQLAEIQNLKVHSHTLEDRVIHSEEQLAVLHDRTGLDQHQLETFQQERDKLYEQFKSMAFGRGRLPPELSGQLVALSKKYPGLQFDPETGISKLDTDILFDSGDASLKPGAERLLDDLVRVLRSPVAGDLKIMVAGHTDSQLVVGKGAREKYPNNFHLSTARRWPWRTG